VTRTTVAGRRPPDPFGALVATLVDVFVRDRDPAQEEVPPMLLPGLEVEPARSRKRA
jgi:hypothetical protein